MAHSQENIDNFVNTLIDVGMTEIENSCLTGDSNRTVTGADELGYSRCPHRVFTYKYDDGYTLYVQINNAYLGPYHLTVILNDDEGTTVKDTQMEVAEFVRFATAGKGILRNHTLNKYDYEQGRYVKPKTIYPVN